MSFSPRKRHSDEAPSTSAPASGSASSAKQSQSDLQPPQENQQSQPVYPWSVHGLPFGQSPSAFLRYAHAHSTSATVTGELFLFGGCSHRPRSPSNDLYVFSTRDFSTTLLKTSGDIPSPRFAHCAVLTSTTLLIWGGRTVVSKQNAQNRSDDDSFYLLNLISRDWTRIVVNGPGPCGRYYHTMTLVDSKLFVFGGKSAKIKSDPFWESYEPAPGNEKPLPRAGHVSVTTGDRIIIFGGCDGPHIFNDTWSFNISTRKWTEIQCAGSIPSPRAGHAAVLIDDVMYVYGGRTVGNTNIGDLTALNLSTRRWTAFQDIGPSPCGRRAPAMACDGRRVFVLGGDLSPGAQVDEAKLIHALDTELLIYPKSESDCNTVKHNAGQTLPGSTHHHDGSTHDLTEQEEYENDESEPRRVPEEDDDGEGSTEHHAKLVALAPSGKEITQLEDGRLVELERQLLETLVAKIGRDRRVAQMTDELALKSALLEQVETTAAEAKNHAELELRALQAKVDELLLSRDQAIEQAQSALQEATFRALLEQIETNVAEGKKSAGLEQRELQAKLDKLLLPRDQALEQARSALQKATFCTAEANERNQRELPEVHAKLEARESEWAAFRLRLADTEDGWAKSKSEADTSRAGTQAAAGLVNMDVDRVMTRLMEQSQPAAPKRPRILYTTSLTPMGKTSTKKRPNGKPALAAAKKRLSLGSTSTSKPHKKTRTRKSVRSHQQTIQARDTLDAEYRDWRTGTTIEMDLLQQQPDGSTTTTPMTASVPQTAGLGSPSVQISEQSVQNLAGVLSAL
ncbi:hypothetical protein BGY98DRAFT_1093720 [Russula aff. rugulosa BPL654]|nr:hypothetical protein BGY98DRAFT_1093720 [Russula aff. rugulosa BPL654]